MKSELYHAAGLQGSATLETISAGSDMDPGSYSPRRPPLPSVQSSGNLSDHADAQSVAPSIDPSELGPLSESGAPFAFPMTVSRQGLAQAVGAQSNHHAIKHHTWPEHCSWLHSKLEFKLLWSWAGDELIEHVDAPINE